MNNPVRWKQRFQNFEKALLILQNRCFDLNENPKGSKYYEAMQMALVQSFEIIVELSWKVLKDYLENQGYDNVQNGKKTIRQVFQDGIIDDAEILLKALEMRNLASHTYNMEMLEELNQFIVSDFLYEVEKLQKKLKTESLV